MSPQAAQARSLYRSILRELPRRPLAEPSPVKLRIRSSFSTVPSSPQHVTRQLQQAEQFVRYQRAQRMYITLLDRYNPGMNMDEEERHRLTVRRVGMNMPTEWKPEENQ